MLIDKGKPIPFTHYFSRDISVVPIDPKSVVSIETGEAFEVTCYMDSCRRFLPPTVANVVLTTGTIQLPCEAIPLALAGGGVFSEALPNPLYNEPSLPRSESEDDCYDWD